METALALHYFGFLLRSRAIRLGFLNLFMLNLSPLPTKKPCVFYAKNTVTALGVTSYICYKQHRKERTQNENNTPFLRMFVLASKVYALYYLLTLYMSVFNPFLPNLTRSILLCLALALVHP